MNPRFGLAGIAALLIASLAAAQPAPEKPNTVSVDWNKIVIVSKSTPTLQVVVNPMLRQGAPIHDALSRR